MPRVGFSPEETVAGGGLFKFDAGYGEIVECSVKNVQIGEYPAHAGLVIGIQRLDKNLKSTDAEVVYRSWGLAKRLSNCGLAMPSQAMRMRTISSRGR